MIALWCGLALAHVPNIASYTLSEQDGRWALDIALPTDGMHQVMKQRHPREALSTVPVATYERYLVEALREGVALTFDGAPAILGPAAVSLAPHETHVHFTVSTPSAGAVLVAAHIDALREHGGQQNVFRLATPTVRTHVVLSDENAYSGVLAVAGRP